MRGDLDLELALEIPRRRGGQLRALGEPRGEPREGVGGQPRERQKRVRPVLAVQRACTAGPEARDRPATRGTRGAGARARRASPDAATVHTPAGTSRSRPPSARRANAADAGGRTQTASVCVRRPDQPPREGRLQAAQAHPRTRTATPSPTSTAAARTAPCAAPAIRSIHRAARREPGTVPLSRRRAEGGRAPGFGTTPTVCRSPAVHLARLRQTVREMGVVTSTGSAGDCFDNAMAGKLLRHARMRAVAAALVQDPSRSAHGHLRVPRILVQHPQVALRAGVPEPQRFERRAAAACPMGTEDHREHTPWSPSDRSAGDPQPPLGVPSTPVSERDFLPSAIVHPVLGATALNRPPKRGSSNHLRTELVLGALNMALRQRRAQGVVHHSDQGSQYTSLAFGKRCREMGVELPRFGGRLRAVAPSTG